MLLERLLNARGISGNEDEVRKILYDEIKDYADDILVDSMGNMIALKKGKNHDKKIMLSAHMDEVGFIISGITDKGYLEFKTVGGIDTRVIISKKVLVGEKKVPGIIGMKAIHLQEKEERQNVPKVKNLYIDIGATSKEEAKKKVSLGDFATFDTKFSLFGDNKIKAKAIDDRVGCYCLVNAIKETPFYDTYFCFLVQEEVGLRGARISAHRIMPDAALVLEATTCSDVYGCREHEYVTELGRGVAITFMDRSSIADKEYKDWIEKLLKAKNIQYQYKKTTNGGNDAGAIYISGKGIKTASLSVPTRYLHSPVGVCDLDDIDAMESLLREYLDKIGDFI